MLSFLIPEDKYEQALTDWLAIQMTVSTDKDKDGLSFLYRISKAQMFERERGEEYPFIGDIRPTETEYQLIKDNNWIESNNLEIRAYCLDLCCRQQKDKRSIRRKASDCYFELYEKTNHSPWFLVRAVNVRHFIKGQDSDFLKLVCRTVDEVYGNWQIRIADKLVKDYHDDITPYLNALENRINNYVRVHDYYEARFVLDALSRFKVLSPDKYHFRKAILYEEEFDYLLSTQADNEYKMKVDVIQGAFKEIAKVKGAFPEDVERIRDKMIAEQKTHAKFIQQFGVKTEYDAPQSIIDETNLFLEGTPMDSPTVLIKTLCSIKFPTASLVKRGMQRLVKASPMLYMSFGQSVALGDSGQTVGKANSEESALIEIHKRFRIRILQLVKCFLADYLNRNIDYDEIELGQSLVDACKSSLIEDSRKVLWVKGIIEGLRGDIITASHLLMPQIERTLVIKAQQYCGDLTNYERERHDQVGLEKALSALKPHLKGVLYDELCFFLINGADVNFRNRIAHGLLHPTTISQEGLYLWWLAIKMLFCEKDFFK